MNLVFSVFYDAMKWLLNLILLIPSLIRALTPFRKKITYLAVYEGRPSADYAVVATYASGGLNIFIRNLIAGFAENQVNVVLVSNCPLAPSDRERVSGQLFALIERENLGRDFGAYQAGIRYLEETGKLASCRKVFLANDSAFYGRTVSQLIATMLGSAAPFIGLFETFEHHYHVSSFFLCFSRDVVASDTFQGFWRRYKPYSTRYHCIFAGEARLTKQLMAQNITPFIIYSTSVVRPAILRLRAAERTEFGAQIVSCIPESWMDLRPSQFGGPALRLPIKLPEGAADAELALLDAFIRSCERANQPHALALCANRVMGAPVIKRDICYRGLWSIASVVHLAEGFIQEERDEMLAMLRRRGVPQSYSGLRRLRLIFDA